MRHAVALFCAVALTSTGVWAEGYGPSLTVLLDFQEAASQASFGEMQREIQQVLKPAGVRVQFRLSSELKADETFRDVVVVRFKGNCRLAQDPLLLDERGPGPLGLAHTSDGQVQPFSDVMCDSVRRAVDSALWGNQRSDRDELFGRALGRVVVHELVHMVGKSSAHGKSGVYRSSLTGSQLIADRLELSVEDSALLRNIKSTE